MDNRQKRHELDIKDFENITSSEIAYFLGYLWADGCIGKTGFSLEINEEDFADIWPVLTKIGFRSFTKRKRGDWKPNCCASSGKQDVLNFLKENGFSQKSTIGPEKILGKIPENLRYYFFRGYFDGDGCLSIYGDNMVNSGFASTYDYDWSFMFDLFNRLGIESCHVRKTVSKKGHKSSIFGFNSIAANQAFYSYVYQNRKMDLIGLSRKYKKYELLLSNVECGIKPNYKDSSCECGKPKTSKSKRCQKCSHKTRKETLALL